jgi:hypothetical protein
MQIAIGLTPHLDTIVAMIADEIVRHPESRHLVEIAHRHICHTTPTVNAVANLLQDPMLRADLQKGLFATRET